MEKLEEQLRITEEEIKKVNADMSVEIGKLRNAHSKRLMDIEQIRLEKERDINSMGKIKGFFLTQKLNIEIFFKKVGSFLKSIKEGRRARELGNIRDERIIGLKIERDDLKKEISKLKQEEENKEQEEYSDSFSYPMSIDESGEIRNMTIDRSDITSSSSDNKLQEENNLDYNSGSDYLLDIPSYESTDLDNIEEKNSEPLSESIDLDHSDITLDYDSDSDSGYSVEIPLSSESIDLDNIEEKNSEPLSESIDLNHSDITSSNLKKEENKQLKEEENSLEESSKELTEIFVTRDTEDKNIIFH